ncbi:phosphotransferase [Bacillus sp. SCS-151]|uniref:phosphotransferase n=1 Tax=Nanhaiella sioensis TaxID=3115293 RepID=UPI0039781663
MTNPWDAEQVVSPKLAKDLIETQFPDLYPVTVSLMGKGFDNTVYLVNEKYVFRFPRRTIAVDLLNTENSLLPILSSVLPQAISHPIFFGKSVTGKYPWPFTGYYRVEGTPPNTLSKLERMNSAKILATFLRSLHDFPEEKARLLGVPFDELKRLDIRKRKPVAEKYIDQIKTLKLYDQVSSLMLYIEQVDHIDVEPKSTLVHGDIHIRNILVNENNTVSGFIDWGDVHIGHPAVDLSIVYSFLPPEGRSVFFSHYGKVDEETLLLAKFKAVFTTIILLMYGYDHNDRKLIEASKQSLDLIFCEENT